MTLAGGWTEASPPTPRGGLPERGRGSAAFTLDDLSLRYLRHDCVKHLQQQLSLLDDDDTDAETIQTTICGRGQSSTRSRRAGPSYIDSTALLGRWSCRSSGCWRRWKVPVSPSTCHVDRAASQFGGQDRDAAGRLRRRQANQPGLTQAAAGRAVRRTGHAEDQTHQDQHRMPTRCSRCSTRPGIRFCNYAPTASPGSRCRRRVAFPSGVPTAASTPRSTQTIAATGRLSSTEPNLQVSDPHRRGPADQDAFVVGTSYAEVDDGRRLNRDADHGACPGTRASSRRSTPGRTVRSSRPGRSACIDEVTGELRRRVRRPTGWLTG